MLMAQSIKYVNLLKSLDETRLLKEVAYCALIEGNKEMNGF
jgi:hypothetical protein